ncbi:MAG TPA: PAS domain S-box protein [Spirochaetota bacterium]|nr:PAS domain S-box protein [Spirochaetota bacterium]HPN13153.1 PAS domain S-box protein [Spirochaetota bacterium]
MPLKQYRTLIQILPVPAVIIDRDGVIRIANIHAAALHGYGSPEELAGIKGLELLAEGERARPSESSAKIVRSGYHRSEYTLLRKDGTEFLAEVDLSPMRDRKGDITSYLAISHDISERTKIDAALRESEERYRIISELSTDYVFKFTVGDDGRLHLAYMSENLQNITGRTPEEVASSDRWIGIIHPDDEAEFLAFQKNLVISGRPDEIECRTFLKNGTMRWIHIFTRPLRDREGGEVTSIIGAIKDVTDRRNAETKLAESEELYRSIIESSPQGMHFYKLEPDGRLVFTGANPAADTILGVDNTQYIGKTIEEAFPSHAQTDIPDHYRTVCKTQSLWHTEEVNYKDARITGAFFVQAFPIGRDRVVAAFYDITDRKIAEAALLETQQRLEYILGVTKTGIDIIDADYNLRYVDPEWQKTYGPYEGKKCYNYFMGRDCACPTCGIPRALETKMVTVTEEVLSNENNRVIEVHSIPFQTRDGHWMVAEFNLDITERKKSEEHIRSSLAEKETLLKEIHHRVKNNMQIITSLLSLQSRYFTDAELGRQFTEAQNRIRSMSLVHETLYQSKDFGHINLRTYIMQLAHEIMSSYSAMTRQINLNLELDQAEITIDHAVPCGLIINELITNSIKHAFPIGWEGSPEISVIFRMKDDGFARLVISDNGVGIPEGTTPGKTDTLGLSLVPLLAEQLRGEATLDRSAGTRFTIRFRP